MNAYTLLWIGLTAVYLKGKRTELQLKECKNTPFVSCVVPACDEQEVIADIIRDLDRQKYRWLEIVVVCHNCVDHTYEEALRVSTRHECKVLQLNTEDSGKALALNYALKHCKGQLVAFFDADNRVPEDFVTKSLPYFASGYDGIQAKILSKNASKNLLTYLQSSEFLLYPKAYCGGKMKLGYNSGVGGTGIMFKRSALDNLQGFRNLLIEDFDLTLRMTTKGYKIAYAEGVVTYDEKVTDWRHLIKQRSRWLAGYFQLWKLYTLKDKLRLMRYPLDFMYYVSPVCIVALLANYILTSLSFIGIAFFTAPLWWWVLSLIITNGLFTLTLREEKMSWKRRIIMPWQTSVFVLHWVIPLFYSFRIKKWSQAKTTHGDSS